MHTFLFADQALWQAKTQKKTMKKKKNEVVGYLYPSTAILDIMTTIISVHLFDMLSI